MVKTKKGAIWSPFFIIVHVKPYGVTMIFVVSAVAVLSAATAVVSATVSELAGASFFSKNEQLDRVRTKATANR